MRRHSAAASLVVRSGGDVLTFFGAGLVAAWPAGLAAEALACAHELRSAAGARCSVDAGEVTRCVLGGRAGQWLPCAFGDSCDGYPIVLHPQEAGAVVSPEVWATVGGLVTWDIDVDKQQQKKKKK
jgi:hypothetical protein